ncbi:hypothetical protein [Sulfurimonas sp.]|uniref:hypothetical protein n=1 Tax=Sulfurimonas sp. TaxID=2022749 RepID=UPI0025FCAA96|nr:hypothetical protein [Sulfurimonas sp.]
MNNIIIACLLSFSLLMGQESTENQPLSEKEVVMVEQGILGEAIRANDYDTISTMALSFYATSMNSEFVGNGKRLYKRSIELLEICHKGAHITSSLYLVKTFLKPNPTYSRRIASESILLNESNNKIRYNPNYISLVMLYVSSVLDHTSTSRDEVNNAIEALQSLPEENAQTKFYSAFLFKSLGSEDIANMYLNDACHSSTVGSEIFKYCTTGERIEREDLLKNKVSNSDCNKDIGQRCK